MEGGNVELSERLVTTTTPPKRPWKLACLLAVVVVVLLSVLLAVPATFRIVHNVDQGICTPSPVGDEPAVPIVELPLFNKSCNVFTLWGLWDDLALPVDRKKGLCAASRKLGCTLSYWGGAAVAELLPRYPAVQEIWCDLPWISRADVGRYMVMHSQGGVYMDSDVEVTGPLPAGDWSLSLQTEWNFTDPPRILGPPLTNQSGYCLRPAQWFFASGGPGHVFWEDVLNLAVQRAKGLFKRGIAGDKWSVVNILWGCGPDSVVTVYNEKFLHVPSVVISPKSENIAIDDRMGGGGWRHGGKARETGCEPLSGSTLPTVVDCTGF